MADHNILEALRVVGSGHVRHAHPFTWTCGEGAAHVEPRTLQRALQQRLIDVEAIRDCGPRPVRLTGLGLAKLGQA
ncbi:MAG TPA: hypothetical protein VEY95_13515 [Azospirillaceae bacterium]|nr:hypothetical protein [Azospirillaceae bacterium]